MNPDPQPALNVEGPRSAGAAESPPQRPGAEAPRFPGGALREWLTHRVTLRLPVWAVGVASLVALAVLLD